MPDCTFTEDWDHAFVRTESGCAVGHLQRFTPILVDVESHCYGYTSFDPYEVVTCGLWNSYIEYTTIDEDTCLTKGTWSILETYNYRDSVFHYGEFNIYAYFPDDNMGCFGNADSEDAIYHNCQFRAAEGDPILTSSQCPSNGRGRHLDAHQDLKRTTNDGSENLLSMLDKLEYQQQLANEYSPTSSAVAIKMMITQISLLIVTVSTLV